MKFRFCGDGDCPDWVLTEIPTLTKLTSIKMKLLCGVVAKALAGEDLDLERARGLTVDAKFGAGDVQGAVAALRWLLGSASRYSVDPESFSSEMQQLGLPREHAQAAAKVFGDHAASVTSHLKVQSLRVSVLEDATCCALPLGVAEPEGVEERRFALSLRVRDCIAGHTATHDVNMTLPQLQELVAELHRARALMDV